MPIIDRPEPGYYKTRLATGGVWVGVMIKHDASQPDRSPHWQCTVDGKDADLWQTWPSCAGYPITRAEYEFMIADAEWCRTHSPNDPKANPRKRADLTTMPPVRW